MLRKLLAFSRRSNRAITDALYERIVAAARQPGLYSDWGVPDTPMGRFEMVSLHMFLFLHRVRRETGDVKDLAQDLTDEFFRDIDHSLRELGISDPGIPRRMKKLSRMFYGRVVSYGAALDASDKPGLEAALRRNVTPGRDDWASAGAVAGYAMSASRVLREQDVAAFLAGEVSFPAPETAEAPA